jgi:GT2 family glycosyltransferase
VSPVSTLSSVVVRREVADRVGHFDTALTWGGDTDWILRAQVAGIPYTSVAEVYLRRRIHDSNLSYSRDSAGALFLRLAKKNIDRNRLERATTEASTIRHDATLSLEGSPDTP